MFKIFSALYVLYGNEMLVTIANISPRRKVAGFSRACGGYALHTRELHTRVHALHLRAMVNGHKNSALSYVFTGRAVPRQKDSTSHGFVAVLILKENNDNDWGFQSFY